MTAPAVEYRDIPGCPGYRVGSDGSVWSCWKQVGLGDGGGTRVVRSEEWRRLKVYVYKAKRTYPSVGLRGKRHLVHRLVLEAFVGPRPPGLVACHADGDPTNNALGNLRWDTYQANCRDAKRHGRAAVGERHGLARLTAKLVRRLRAEYAAGGATVYALAKRHGLNSGTLWLVLRRKTWRHV